MSSGRTGIDMKAHECLCALINTTLNTIKKIITGIIAVLLAGKNNLETIRFKLILACRHYLPGKIGLAFAIALRTRVRSTVTSIESDYANVASGASGISRNTIRRIGALQRLLNRLCLNSISVPICIINRCALGVHRAIYDGERIISIRKIDLMFSPISL